jgi:hypothetical protein
MMTIDKLATLFHETLLEQGAEMADVVRDEAVKRYGRSFVMVALRRYQQAVNAERNAANRA